jgi:hypothetical protein
MADYLEIKEQFEAQLSSDLKFELLELHYAPYSFGSGILACRINGRAVKIVFDGKDSLIELLISAQKYPSSSWTTIFTGTPIDFISHGVAQLNVTFADK